MNTENFERSLREAAARRLSTLIVAVNDYAKLVIDVSQPLVPVKTGDLKASWFITPAAETSSGGLIATVGYGGGDVDYAIWVHEILTNAHSQGQAKYLETAMRAAAPDFVPFIAKRLEALQ